LHHPIEHRGAVFGRDTGALGLLIGKLRRLRYLLNAAGKINYLGKNLRGRKVLGLAIAR
jgi:hypothetical protein